MNTTLDHALRPLTAHLSSAAMAIALMILTCPLVAQTSGQNLLRNGDAETGTSDGFVVKGGSLTVIPDAASSGQHGFELTPSADGGDGAKACQMVSTDLVPVDPSKTYQLSAMLQSAGSVESQEVYLGLIPFDSGEKEIIAQSVNHLPGTETELTEDVNKEGNILSIQKGDQWKAGPLLYVAFDVDDSGAFGDLPSRKLSGIGIDSVTDQGTYWEVQLTGKARNSYPAGTKVRLHTAGGTYIYCGANNRKVPREWKEFKGTVTGVAQGRSDTQFWPGTSFVKVVLLPGRRANEQLLVDDITLKEVQP